MQQVLLTYSTRTSSINFILNKAVGGIPSGYFLFIIHTNTTFIYCAIYTYIFHIKNSKLLQSTIFFAAFRYLQFVVDFMSSFIYNI